MMHHSSRWVIVGENNSGKVVFYRSGFGSDPVSDFDQATFFLKFPHPHLPRAALLMKNVRVRLANMTFDDDDSILQAQPSLPARSVVV